MNIDIVDRRLSGRDAGVCLSKSNSDVKPLGNARNLLNLQSR
jgi:hypothetical protein